MAIKWFWQNRIGVNILDFENIIGNDEVKKYLFNSIKQNKLSQSYLFVGTEGIGKLLIAKAFAKKILCNETNKNNNCECKSCKCFEGLNHMDFTVLNEEGQTIKIDQIREMTNKIIEQPIVSDKKVYILNDCEKMTIEAQNCLLKTLEEPPKFAVIILITSNENLLLNTIKSRCMTIKLKNISNEELQKYAKDKLNITQMTENFLKSLSGSIGKAIIQKENQEKFWQIERLMDNLSTQDMIDYMKDAQIIYDKENIDKILEYMMICTFAKRKENPNYINCVEKINYAKMRLKRNCNFDMTLDTMLFEMWETIQKGI